MAASGVNLKQKFDFDRGWLGNCWRPGSTNPIQSPMQFDMKGRKKRKRKRSVRKDQGGPLVKRPKCKEARRQRCPLARSARRQGCQEAKGQEEKMIKERRKYAKVKEK